MVQQIRRAAFSVHLNLAEGASRKSVVERKRFYEIFRGFLIEVDTAIGIAFELKYLSLNDINKLGETIVNAFKLLTRLIAHEG